MADQETTSEPAAASPRERASIKELIQRYGSLALGIYLSTALVAFTLGVVVFGFFLEPASPSGPEGQPPAFMAKLVDGLGLDSEGYYRADQLYQEVELVLEATCTACSAGR